MTALSIANAAAGAPGIRRARQRTIRGLRALVTGASSGVGRAVAGELARRGARVLATARREDRLAALAAAHAGAIVGVGGDVTDESFRVRLVTTMADRFGGIDLVVAAAGVGAIGRFRDGTAGMLARIIDVDFLAAAELVRGCLPRLAESPDPAIVLVGSILGSHPLPLHGDYCAAKAALRSLAQTLRMELADDGIEVLLASLGPTESEFWDQLLAGSRPVWSRGRPLSAERTATAIVDGLRWRRRNVVPGWQARGFVLLARLFPSLIEAAVRRVARPIPPGARMP